MAQVSTEQPQTKHIQCGGYDVTVVERVGEYFVSYEQTTRLPEPSDKDNKEDVDSYFEITTDTTEDVAENKPEPLRLEEQVKILRHDHSYGINLHPYIVVAGLTDFDKLSCHDHDHNYVETSLFKITRKRRKQNPISTLMSGMNDAQDSDRNTVDQNHLTNSNVGHLSDELNSDSLIVKTAIQDRVVPDFQESTVAINGSIAMNMEVSSAAVPDGHDEEYDIHRKRLGKDIHHNMQEMIKCKFKSCTKWFCRIDRLILHENSHLKQKCKCSGCRAHHRARKKPASKQMALAALSSVYELKCTECQERYLTTISASDPYLDEYVKSGIKIHCTKCSTITVSPVVFVSEKQAKEELESPTFLCSHPSCGVSVYLNVHSLRTHRKKVHPQDLEPPATIPTEESASGEPRRKLMQDETSEQYASLVMGKGRRSTVKTVKRLFYYCPVTYCLRKFVRYDRLCRHHLLHEEGEGSCTCRGCRRRYSSLFSVECSGCLKKHIISNKKYKTSYIIQRKTLDILCNSCGKITRSAPLVPFEKCGSPIPEKNLCYLCPDPKCDIPQFQTLTSLGKHMKCHFNGVVFCNHCQQEVPNCKSLRNHLPFCSNLSAPSKCFLCDNVLRNKYHLADHMRRRHKKNTMLCEDCGETFPKHYLWKRHQVRKHGKHDLEEKYDVPLERNYLCSQCARRFSSKALLNQHLRRIHGPKDKICKVCGKVFSTQDALKKHNFKHTKHETDLSQFRCKICHRSFSSNYRLSEHVKRIHEGKRDSCPDCGKEFRTRDGMKLHLKFKHQLEFLQNFTCSECDKTYTSKVGLTHHMKKVHSHSVY